MQYNINQYLEADDDELFALIEKGDEKAFTRVYEKYHKLLYVVVFMKIMHICEMESRIWFPML